MKWTNVKWIFFREVRDQLRDRRTLFTIAVLPLLLYPLLGMLLLQITQFTQEHPTTVLVLGSGALPREPALLDDQRFAAVFADDYDASRLNLTVRESLPEDFDVARTRRYAELVVQKGEYDAVVLFPADFATKLARFRAQLLSPNSEAAAGDQEQVPEPEIFANTASDKSRIAQERVDRILRQWRAIIVAENLRQRNVPAKATEPFQLVSRDVAHDQTRRAMVWSKVLPFAALIWALTGAFYPAIDLCAGEKERGTLETLLCSPAQRGEIVWGKLLTVMAFSMATSILNLFSMGLTSLFILGRISQLAPEAAGLNIGTPPLSAVGWLLLALIPIAALFSALALAIAAFARSTKEGQYYLMPLLMVTLPLMMLPLLPTTELELGTSLIPVTGLMLLVRTLIEGQYVEALRFVGPVVGITAICCLLSIRWAVNQFNNESVLFRESERWDLGVWLRHVVRDRGETPSLSEALLCGVLILMIRFFAGFSLSMPESWPGFATTTVVTLIAFIATPALIMAIVLTRNPRKTLLLRMPKPSALSMAILLAFAIHPAGVALAEGVKALYPVGADMGAQMREMGTIIGQAPSLWSVLFVLAIMPAICEELAFRGFILSGLRHVGRKWTAILISAVLFGAAHGVWQQSLTACVLGLVIGYLAVQSGSLLPGLLFHAIYNGLSLSLAWNLEAWSQHFTSSEWLLRGTGDSFAYSWPMVLASLALSAALLLGFRNLPYEASAEESLNDALVRGERLADETP
jgi:sodium transport system permease protein